MKLLRFEILGFKNWSGATLLERFGHRQRVVESFCACDIAKLYKQILASACVELASA
jgi:hypothetical protein